MIYPAKVFRGPEGKGAEPGGAEGWSGVPYADAPIWAAAAAARASHREQCGPFRHYALLASWQAVKTAEEAALARFGSSPGVTEAGHLEQDAQHRDLFTLVKGM